MQCWSTQSGLHCNEANAVRRNVIQKVFTHNSLTLTSDVSRWQFLHERAIEEKVRSGWSNLLPLALRKNVVNGSYRQDTHTQTHTEEIIRLFLWQPSNMHEILR